MVSKRKSEIPKESVVDTNSISLFIAGADRSEVKSLVRTQRETADKPFQIRCTESELIVLDELVKLMGVKSRAEAIRCMIAEKYEDLKY